jgi:hypothetical protein
MAKSARRNELLLLLYKASTGKLTKEELLQAAGEDQIWFDLDGTVSKNMLTGEVKTPAEMEAYMKDHGNFWKVTLDLK